MGAGCKAAGCKAAGLQAAGLQVAGLKAARVALQAAGLPPGRGGRGGVVPPRPLQPQPKG